ncbi:hypothetical protein D3C81_1907740 [compost metagenome]
MLKDSVSSMPRRSCMATTAHSAPIRNGMRQPQLSSCSTLRVCCRTISTARAINWPEISVTYWKLAKKPRLSLVAISLR